LVREVGWLGVRRSRMAGPGLGPEVVEGLAREVGLAGRVARQGLSAWRLASGVVEGSGSRVTWLSVRRSGIVGPAFGAQVVDGLAPEVTWLGAWRSRIADPDVGAEASEGLAPGRASWACGAAGSSARCLARRLLTVWLARRLAGRAAQQDGRCGS
jgi:hypothetical protein